MSSAKAVLGSVLGRFIFRAAEVTGVTELAPSFRQIELAGAALRDAAFQAGDKLQVFLPGVGTRTYSPLHWDAQRGATAIVAYLHGDGPGATWAAALRAGTPVQLFGPRRSLALPESAAPAVVFGDETSFGVTAALARSQPARAVTGIFEVGERERAEAAVRALGLDATLVLRAPGEAHLAGVEALLRSALGEGSSTLLMTGRATAIQALRARLKSSGIAPRATKAYWSPGKTGLD